MRLVLDTEKIKLRLRKLHWRYYKFAQVMDASQSWVFQLMHKESNIRLETVCRIAIALGIDDPRELLKVIR